MNRRYVYTVTNRISIVLLIILTVTLGSLIIKWLLPPGYEWVLQQIAWPVWLLAVLIRLAQRAFELWQEGKQ